MRSSGDVPVHAIWLAQDDPKKNTAVRLSKRGELILHERFNQITAQRNYSRTSLR